MLNSATSASDVTGNSEGLIGEPLQNPLIRRCLLGVFLSSDCSLSGRLNRLLVPFIHLLASLAVFTSQSLIVLLFIFSKCPDEAKVLPSGLMPEIQPLRYICRGWRCDSFHRRHQILANSVIFPGNLFKNRPSKSVLSNFMR